MRTAILTRRCRPLLQTANLLVQGLLLAGSVLSGCRKDPAPSTGPIPDTDAPIVVCPFVESEITTKVGAPIGSYKNMNDLGGIGLFASWLPYKDYTTESIQPYDDNDHASNTPQSYIRNAQVSMSDSAKDVVVTDPGRTPYSEEDSDNTVSSHYWRAGQGIYWPVSGSLSFFAYAPYDAGVSGEGPLVIDPDYSNGYPKVTFTVDNNALNQKDFLTATHLDLTKSSPADRSTMKQGELDLQFFHQLTWIDFEAECSASDWFRDWVWDNITEPVYGVSAITLNNIAATGKGTFQQGDKGFIWYEPAKKDHEFSLVRGKDPETSPLRPLSPTTLTIMEEGVESYKQLVEPKGYLYMIPQTLSGDATLTIEYGIYSRHDTDYSLEVLYVSTFNIGRLPIPDDNIWGSGTHVTYRMILDLTDGSLSTVSAVVEPWNGESEYYIPDYIE